MSTIKLIDKTGLLKKIYEHPEIDGDSGLVRALLYIEEAPIVTDAVLVIRCNVFQRIIYGVRFLCAVDDKECPYENCYDTPEWDDSVCDMVIRNPLPSY